MTAPFHVRGAPPWQGAHGAIRWICTSNPFYVISAGLFLFGLRISFGAQVRDIEVGALMAGLTGYTLLLAVTALVLVRFGNVWDDVRTVLLLVVLMFLATSVTFDELLVADPQLGQICGLGGFAFAVAISEMVLRGIRLTFPGWFRGPYYLILGLFFLYPLALIPILDQPKSEALQWGLFAFSTVAGLAFLTLLPAVWRGPAYVRNNGSPWPWPLYPWVVFGVLALATPARAYLMCMSMHWLDMAQGTRTIFGLYFLAPLGLCLSVLLLEIGIVSRRRAVTNVALVAPFGFIAAALIGHPSDPVYQGFLHTFRDRLGGDPAFWTLLGTAAFYGYAAARQVEGAIGAATGMLAALWLMGPDSVTRVAAPEPLSWPIGLAALVQIGVGVWKRNSLHWLIGAGAALAFTLSVSGDMAIAGGLRGAMALHVVVVVLAVGGALCRDDLARHLRVGAGGLLIVMAAAALLGDVSTFMRQPRWLGEAYPFVAATALGCYGVVRRDPVPIALAVGILSAWFAKAGWHGYRLVRTTIAGFDLIVLSLILFVVAVAVSLGKSGRVTTWFLRRGWLSPTDDIEPL
jgi:hypothetical protein